MCFMSLALGAYLFVTSINGYMKNDMKPINKVAKGKKSKLDISKQLSIIIREHTGIKQLSFSSVLKRPTQTLAIIL